jgi:predicted short-subunit dehydrogenase-like oxidoreductase (DUF2520 family)
MGLALGSVLADADAFDELLFIGRRSRAPQHPVLALPGVGYSVASPGPVPGGTRVLFAVPDGAITPVASEIARHGDPGPGSVALHLSGALPTGALAVLAECGYAVGSLHPLQTVADPLRGAERLKNAFFTFEGEGEARDAAADIVNAAGGRMLEVHAADKARYHAACVFASNYVVACGAVATRLLASAAGIGEGEAARALRPLWGGAIANLDQLGPSGALTGPVRRGDLETVKAHLAALDGDTRQVYAELAWQAVQLAKQAGLDAKDAEAIETEIKNSRIGGAGQR